MAIRERRQIVFDAEEICTSLQNVRSIDGRSELPPVRPVRIEFLPEKNSVLVQYDSGASGNYPPLTLSGAMLAVLLMKCCSIRRVPLPRHGHKSLEVTDNAVVLSIDLAAGDGVGG